MAGSTTRDTTAATQAAAVARTRQRLARYAAEMREAGWMAVAPETVLGFVAAHRTAPDQIPGGLLDALYGAYEATPSATPTEES